LLFGPAAIVEFNGIEEQYIGNIPEFADVDVVLNNSSGLVLTGEFAIEDLRLVNGALIAGEHTLSLSGDLTMTPFAFLETEGTVTLTGDDDQAVAAPNMSFRDLLINGNNKTVDIQQPLSIRGLLSFLGTGAILKTNDHLRLISISVDDNDNGRIGPLINGNMLEGDVIVERWMPTGRTYRYLASPVQEATVADLKDDFPITGSFSDPSSGRGIISENPSLFFYSEADPTGWIGYPSTDSAKNNPLNPGLGYCAFIRQANAPVTWSVSGAINRGNIILPVTFSPGQDSLDGWNLVGNPYPCPIKWDDPGWTKENIASGIAVKDNNAGRFRIWDGAIGDLPEGAIATGQAFWVRTTAATPHLAISESVKHTGASAFFRKTPDPDYVRISATQSIHSDNAYLRILPIAKHEIDEHDIPKLKNDFLSLSLVTADGSEVALRADNILSCNVDLKVRITSYNKRDTIYLTAIGHGKFEYTTITFRDTRTGQKIVQNRQGKYLIAPADVGYVVLNLTSARATPGEVELAKFRCTDQPMDVKIKNWQPGFEYFMVRKDLIDARTFTTNDSVIHMQASWHEGYYHVIKAGICDSDTLLRNIFVSKPVTPAVDSAFLCETGTALLHAAGAEDNQIYEWLNSDEVVFHTGGSLVTQLLTKTRTYSVRINDLQSKCLSEMATANAIVHPIDSIGMSYDGHNLTAMVDPPVEWFHSGEKLPFEGNVFVPAEKGHYTVKKNLAGEECPAMGMFTVTELKLPDKTVYPNPSDGEVRFRNGSPGILKDVIDITGASVFYLCDLDCSEQECRLEIRSLSPGTYFLTFDDKGHLFYIRIFVY
jgi:hypothetical protein